MNFEQAWQEAEKMTGFLFSMEAKALHDLTLEIPENGVVVELGSFCGKSTRVIIDALIERRGKIYCVDAFIDHFDCNPTSATEALKQFTDNILIKHYDHAELIKKTTNSASRYFKHEIDFLFIDADHSYKGVKDDCKNWLPKLKSGACVAFHDFHDANWLDVQKAALEFVGSWNNVRNDGSLAVFRKP